MDYSYGDILSAHRPVHDGDAFSRRHPKMAQLNRAKLFAPFAALSGFDDAVRSKEVPYVPKHILDADETYELNAVLNALYLATRTGELVRRNRVFVCVEYFAACVSMSPQRTHAPEIWCSLKRPTTRMVHPTSAFMSATTR